MADNTLLNPTAPGGDRVATDEVTYSGDTAQVQLTRVVSVTGAEGSKTVTLDACVLLNSLDTKLPTSPAQDRTTAAAPSAVRLSNGTAFIAPALETGGNLDTLVTRTTVGQNTMAASRPVAIASDQTPVPTLPQLGSASGNITTQNLVPNGAATAGSAVELVLNGAASMGIQVTNTYTGALSVQVTWDGSRWETISGATVTNALSGVAAATIASATIGVFTVPVHGALRARVTGLAAMTGTATVSLRALAAATTVYTLQPTAANFNVTVSGTVTASNTAGTAAQGAAASGNPVFVGGIAKTAQPTARTDGQMVAELFDKVGRGVIRQGQVRDLTDFNPQVTLSGTTETTLVAAVAATFNDLQALEIASTAAFSGTPTGVRLDFRDVTAGTVRLSVSLPAGGGVFNWNRSWMGSELKQATVNTAWTVQLVFVGGTAPAVSSGDIRVTPQTVRNI